MPVLPDYATNNSHLFYLVCRSLDERTVLIARLRQLGILVVFHYQPLHQSPYYTSRHDGRALPWADHYADQLIRLPLFYELSEADQRRVTDEVLGFYQTY